ncbi:chemotaxis protein CheC [Salinarchaeum sp. IM2453]|uniref:chemotaxis protein CheC n=1 Tax=Salinarchaeum sp. IM2453 TaxID=2862870 RepID=UPI001C831DD1|nr:chemotaxis protein CheC [Salinarchaeum sp. IM2453]QZA89560.1 chemotaxis protein CheC [Salinarchaeum sp. IM2453]
MRLDIQTLGTVNQLAHDGAQAAANSLIQLTGTETDVEVTRVDLVPLPDLAEEFTGEEFVGVEIETSGSLTGTVVLVFDRDSTMLLLDSIMPESWGDVSSDMDKSGVSEVANIMIGGFVDAWADHFSTKITLSPPKYVAGEWPSILPEDVPLWNERETAMTFTSQLTTESEVIDFHIYLFPERDSFQSLLADTFPQDRLPISMDKLSVFNEMTKAGAGRAAEKVTQMTNIETDVEISRFTFVPFEDIDGYLTDDERIIAITNLQAPPGGYIVVLFDMESARVIADALLPIETEGNEFTDQHQAAIEEIGNIMTSGFIDGWANTLNRKIQHVPPDVVNGPGATTLRSLIGDFEERQDYLFLFDSTIQTPEQAIGLNIFAIPDQDQLQTVLDELSVDEATSAIDDPESFEPSSYDDLK